MYFTITIDNIYSMYFTILIYNYLLNLYIYIYIYILIYKLYNTIIDLFYHNI